MQQSSYRPEESGLLRIEQVEQHLGLSRAKVYRLIQREGLPVIHFGRSVRVSPLALNDWLTERATAQQEERQQ